MNAIDNVTELLDAQEDVFRLIATDSPLVDTLRKICELIELVLNDKNALTSIVLIDELKISKVISAQLPKAYSDALIGIEIGPSVGSCGTAMYKKESVIVEDIASNPLWADYKQLALEHNLLACWSTPIIKDDTVLGSFAIYYSKPHKPNAYELPLLEKFSALAKLAIVRALDVTERNKMLFQIKRINQQLKTFTEVLPDLAFIIDQDGYFVESFGGDEDLLVYPDRSFHSKNIKETMPADVAEKVFDSLKRLFKTGEVQQIEYELDVQIGRRHFEARIAELKGYDIDGKDTKYALSIARDVTEKKQAQQEAERLAFYDPLTDLPNRRLMTNRLQQLLDRVKREQLYGAALFLDLDNFKRINDSLGHSVGDELLQQVAQRLKPIIRTTDTIARLGGDEFIILIENCEPSIEEITEEASIIAQKLLGAFTKPIPAGHSNFQLSASIGIAIFNQDYNNIDDILKQADAAMYRSKSQSGNEFSFFDPKLQRIIDQQLEIERDIITAIEKKQFIAYFQPQVGMNGDLIGVEALVRWNHPEKGVLSPYLFLSVAEQFGLINQIEQQVFEQSCQLLLELMGKELTTNNFSVAVNLSAGEFKSVDLAERLVTAVNKYQLLPSYFKLEITESMLVDKVEQTIHQMEQLKQQGFKLSIDDFGTGYSSLNYLHTFPINELKIDKSFIDKMITSKSGNAIINAIISLAFNLDIKVIAEGVETEEQFSILKQKYVSSVQGYYFAKPMPKEELFSWITKRNTISSA